MARNRQNLIGRSGANVQLARALGIHLVWGGHNVISTILHSARVVDGERLVEKHPEWFGLDRASGATQADPVPFNAESYINPCVADAHLIAFFAAELATRLIDGDLQDVTVLNLWPSDSPRVNLPAACLARMPGLQPTAHLIKFYSGVMRILQAEIARRAPHRRLMIAGISYYDTWETPDPDLLSALAPLPNVRFMQVLYVNERSYSMSISPTTTGTNRKIHDAIAAWSTALSPHGIEIGICDYYNYSAYYSLPASFAAVLPADFDTYERQSASLITYMHPIRTEQGPQRLQEALRSRLAWKGAQSARGISRDYFHRMFGPLAVEPVFADVDRALSNLTEMFGATSSLLNMLGQHKIWAQPALAEAKVPGTVGAYLKGGHHRLPVIRDTYFSPLESEFVGLLTSVQLLRSAEQRAAALVAGATGNAKTRLEQDVAWISFARAIYEAVASIALGVAPATEGGLAKEEAERRLAAALDDVRRHDRFGWTFSAFDQRAMFQQRIGDARSRLTPVP